MHTLTWDYPPEPTAHRDALLSRGASHSRFLRIAYSSTRSPIVSPSSSSTNRPHSRCPKPPHYHASLLRSPLSRRKGLFRTVLSPNNALDFFRRDVLLASAPSFNQQRGRKKRCRVECSCDSVHGVAESVLESYEAAAGFSGWHGLGIRVQQKHDCWDGRGATYRREKSAGKKKRPSDLGLEMDELQVEEGRAKWALVAQDLVGPPGVVLRWVIENTKSDVVLSSRPEEAQWDPDIGYSRSRPSFDSDAKQPPPPSGSKPKITSDSPSAWWYGPSPHHGPPTTPHMHSFRFPPPPSVQYGVPSLQFSPWFPSGRVTSTQGQGYWYSPQPIGPGAPSPTSRDPNQGKAFVPHSHVFASPVTPASVHSPHSPTKPNLGRREDEWVRDSDKETETDHGYESTTTTTDSDPPPHTPIGAHGVEIDTEHVSPCETLGLSDPSTPVKLLGRFSSCTSAAPGSNPDGRESSKAAVVFPSLNGSFRQGSLSHISVSLPGQGVSTQMTPVRTLTPVSPLSHLSTNECSGNGEQDCSKMKLAGSGEMEPSSACSALGDGSAFMHPLGSSPPTNFSPGLRKDSQGFWESMTPISPCLSSSSLSLSPSVSKPAARWIGERTSPIPEESHESSSEDASSQFTPSAKSRSLSPSPRRVTSAGSTRSSSSQPASYSSPTSTPASGSYRSSPSPLNESSSLVPPPDPTLSNATTLLPAFLTATSAKRKKASRTREIVDRLRSSSVDAGKCGVPGMDGLGWLVGELDGTKHGSENVGGERGLASPLQSDGDAGGTGSGLDVGKRQSFNSSTSESDLSRSRDRTTTGSGTVSSLANADSKGITTTTTTIANAGVTPFPILSVSQKPSGTTNHHSTPLDGTDGLKRNAISKGSSSHSQLSVGALNGGASPSKHPSHHPLPSAPVSHPHPAVHPHPVSPLAPPPPPPMIASPFQLQPVYVSFPQYHVVPAPAPVSPVHPGPQGQLQGTWMAVYPALPPPPPPPPHVTMHPLSVPITGVSGMRHASW